MSEKQPDPPGPPGLEHLSQINQLVVCQEISILTKFQINDINGQKLYFAEEIISLTNLACFGTNRQFQLKIMDISLNEVIYLDCPFGCYKRTLTVSSPPGTVIGSVTRDCTFTARSLSVKNAGGDIIFKIKAPMFTLARNIKFKIYERDGESVVGNITKQWAGMAQELLLDVHNFSIRFPVNADVRVKAVLLGACFMVDFMFYEE